MKVVINRCFGGFSLSKEAYEYLGIPWDGYGFRFVEEWERTDERLVKCVERLGFKASGTLAELKVVEIPDDVDWYIDNYDGMESVEECHRSWE